MLSGARKDRQLVTKDWRKIEEQIDGVVVREVLHVPRDHGVITEIFRPEWDPTGLPIVHIYQSRLFPAAIGAWSCHARTHRSPLRQSRPPESRALRRPRGKQNLPAHRRTAVGDARPAFLVLPAGIWHGLQNLGPSDALVINCPTKAYNYEDPDHYRLPFDSTEIPYTWTASAGARLRSDAR